MEGVNNDNEYVTKEFNIMMNAFGDDPYVNYFDRESPQLVWNDIWE